MRKEVEVIAAQAEQQSVGGRTELGRLLNDCRKGKMDVILTKSISRFVRNTRDTLLMINELNQLRVTVFFELEGVNTREKKFRQYICDGSSCGAGGKPFQARKY